MLIGWAREAGGQNLGKNGTVLDLGCGNGSLSHELSKLGF